MKKAKSFYQFINENSPALNNVHVGDTITVLNKDIEVIEIENEVNGSVLEFKGKDKDGKIISFKYDDGMDEYSINEGQKDAIYNTNFKGMAQSAIAGLYNSIMAIAQEFANEKVARNPSRYDGKIEDIDITRAMNLIFHSDWKKKIKAKCLDQVVKSSMDRAGKQDAVVKKKNIRSLGRSTGDKDFNLDIDKSSVRFSDERGVGPGSNQ